VPHGCADEFFGALPARVESLRPDVVVLMTTSWDVIDRRWDGTTTLGPHDAEFEQRLVTDFGELTDRLIAAGAGAVAWIRPPIPNPWWLHEDVSSGDDASRLAVLDGVYELLAECTGLVTCS
jgi:hypothetical protein